VTAGSGAPTENGAPPRRIRIVLQAGVETHEGRARGLHALLYATELRQAGVEVRLVFDGAGTEYLARLVADGEHSTRARPLFDELRAAGLAYEVCDRCSGAFEVRDELMEAGETLSSAYEDHPSIARHVVDGFEVWIL
jgi:predicted peroxiredoxin